MLIQLGPLAVMAAGLAGVAAALAVSSPASQQPADIAVQNSVGSLPRRWSWIARLLAGRSDAPSLQRRCGVATAASLMIALSLQRSTESIAQSALIGIPLSVLAMTVGLGWMEPRRTRRRRRQMLMDVPQALELMAACLAAGLPLRAATTAVVSLYPGPLGEDLGSVLRMVDLGAAETDAWRTLRGHPELDRVAVDLARSVDSGTMLIDALNHHAEAARQRRLAALQVAARGVGVRSVLPMMTCFLPAFVLVGVVPSVVSAILNALS